MLVCNNLQTNLFFFLTFDICFNKSFFCRSVSPLRWCQRLEKVTLLPDFWLSVPRVLFLKEPQREDEFRHTVVDLNRLMKRKAKHAEYVKLKLNPGKSLHRFGDWLGAVSSQQSAVSSKEATSLAKLFLPLLNPYGSMNGSIFWPTNMSTNTITLGGVVAWGSAPLVSLAHKECLWEDDQRGRVCLW